MKKRKFFTIISICILTVLSCLNVSADTESSWKTLCTRDGVTYKGKSSVYADTGTAWGSAYTNASSAVSTGKMGAAARLYKSNGTLLKSSTTVYNGSSVKNVRATTGFYDGTGYFYGKGVSYVYNGDGYTGYSLYQTPMDEAAIVETYGVYKVQRNEHGEIYGSEYFLNQQGIEPDLILAIGKNGNEGYVRAEDLNKTASTLIEAINFDSSTYEIPVYEVDGKTIIDSFIVEESPVN